MPKRYTNEIDISLPTKLSKSSSSYIIQQVFKNLHKLPYSIYCVIYCMGIEFRNNIILYALKDLTFIPLGEEFPFLGIIDNKLHIAWLYSGLRSIDDWLTYNYTTALYNEMSQCDKYYTWADATKKKKFDEIVCYSERHDIILWGGCLLSYSQQNSKRNRRRIVDTIITYFRRCIKDKYDMGLLKFHSYDIKNNDIVSKLYFIQGNYDRTGDYSYSEFVNRFEVQINNIKKNRNITYGNCIPVIIPPVNY